MTGTDHFSCSHCNEGFETLTRKRLHDCPEEPPDAGPEEWEERDVSGQSLDGLAEQTTRALLKCVHCDQHNDEIRGHVDSEYGPGGIIVVAEYDCEHCGKHQRNTAELS